MKTRQREDLFPYFRREMDYLRRMSGDYARRYPKVAARLELGQGECPDPHVERLLESFALLTARIQQNLDNEFPEITSALMGILYPHYLNPVPSAAIAQCQVDPEQGKLTSGHLIAKGTPLFVPAAAAGAEAMGEDPLLLGPGGRREEESGATLTACRFRTCYPVTLWPLEVVEAGFEPPGSFKFLEGSANVGTVLRLRLQSQGVLFEELELDRLRFFLDGDPIVANTLYEIIFGNLVQAALSNDARPYPRFLPAGAVQPVGFGLDEEVLPYPRRSHPGYRLLQEFFAFPEKFLFFDLHHLQGAGAGKQLDVLLLLDRPAPDDLRVGPENFKLGCTPVVNLFAKTTEPLRLDQRRLSYRLIPDMRRERWTEIHSILKVSTIGDPDVRARSFEPFYSFNHRLEKAGQTAFWHAQRRLSERADLPGTEMFLTFVDLDFRPTHPPDQTAYAHTLCTNRRLAEQIPAGARFHIEEAAPLFGIFALKRPSPQITPPLGGSLQWRLISHLSLNHLSLTEGEQSLEALREMLRLYRFSSQSSSEHRIMGMRRLSTRRVMRPLPGRRAGVFARGLEVSLTMDEDYYVGGSAFLMASVLNHFLALYASLNSFTQLALYSRQREGIWKKWPPMAGDRIIL